MDAHEDSSLQFESTQRQRALDSFDRPDNQLPALPINSDSFLREMMSDGPASEDHESQQQLESDDERSLDEKELRRQFMEVESSFVPEHALESDGDNNEKLGADDTYLEIADPVTLSKSRSMASGSLRDNRSSVASPTTAATKRYKENKPLISSLDGSNLTLDSDPDNSLSSVESASVAPAQKPAFLATRQVSNQSSQASAMTPSDFSGSDATIGADLARSSKSLFSGNSRAAKLLDRLPSLGSNASNAYDSDSVPVLHRKRSNLADRQRMLGVRNTDLEPATPKANPAHSLAPTDTVLAARINSIQVPETVARDFRAKNGISLMDKRPVSSDGPIMSNNSGDRVRRTLTLKEQNGKVDKLTKENFDLKLKIHFLDQALRSHSDEGVQELIDKNVQFQTDLANERKDLQNLRRRMRELERKVKEQESTITDLRSSKATNEAFDGEEGTLQAEMHEEILYLRQQLDHSENQVTTLREEMITEKLEKRKMADHMRSMAGNRTEDSNGVRETMDMWQDLLNAETGRREQAEEDLRKLREELTALRIEKASPVANRAAPRFRRGLDEEDGVDGNGTETNAVLVQQLRHENAELRRDLGAQTSMLTSRNRERERLQQEIEDLKLLQRKGDGARSVAGDSIFDRSISRAHNRGQSRASNHNSLAETEREDWERKEGLLRDQNAELKLKFQDLERTHATHLQYITALEGDFQEMEGELNDASEDLKALSAERDEALQSAEELQQDYERLEQEAVVEIDKLEKELQNVTTQRQKSQSKLEQTIESYRSLQSELRIITQSVMNLEDEKQTSLRTIETLEQQISETEDELARWEEKCKEFDQKNRKLEVTGESLHAEVSFLREEQEGDKIKIGELEDALNAAQQTIQDEQEKLKELEDAIVDERQQRDVLENKSKDEVQKVLDDLNTENGKNKDDIRRLRREVSAKEVDANQARGKLEDLELAFKHALGIDGSKHNMLEEIDRLQRDLEVTANQLDRSKMDHADKDRLLRHRDGLLESTSLESRRLSDLLDKERSARKHDLDQFEKASRGQATNLRQIAQYESRILELETGFSQDKRKMAALEQQFRDQLGERNSLLLALWNRLSTLCGADWSQNHALVDGEVPSAEAISRSLPSFQRNIISAIKNIESVIGGFKSRIRAVEKDLVKDYQTLEHNLDMRIRRMDLVERAVADTQARIAEDAAAQQQQQPTRQTPRRTLSKSFKSNDETSKLKNEVKLLKAELKFHRQHPSAMAQQMIHQQNQLDPEHGRRMSRDSSSFKPPSPARQIVAQLLRQQSNKSVEPYPSPSDDVPGSSHSNGNRQSIVLTPTQSQPSEQKWVLRLREMERKLKAEREARLLDRKGARQRLEDGRLENEELRMMLERERMRHGELATPANEEYVEAQHMDEDDNIDDAETVEASHEHD